LQGTFPQVLKEILESTRAVFVGRSVTGDARHLYEDWSVHIAESQLVSLERLCHEKNLVERGNLSLQDLTRKLIGNLKVLDSIIIY
jgi:hypothetical protein